MPTRGHSNSASVYLGAPYGVYRTHDGFIAIAMNPVGKLGELIDCAALVQFADSKKWFSDRDAIKQILYDHLRSKTTAHWLGILEPADIWCADVLTWPRLFAHDGFKALRMIAEVETENGARLQTTRCPIRIDGAILTSRVAAPKVGQHTREVAEQYALGEPAG